MTVSPRQYFPLDEAGVAAARSKTRSWMCWSEELTVQATEAMNGLVRTFAADLGRLPTRAELLAGILQGMPDDTLPDIPWPAADWAPLTDPGSPEDYEPFEVIGAPGSETDVDTLIETEQTKQVLEGDIALERHAVFTALLMDAVSASLLYQEELGD